MSVFNVPGDGGCLPRARHRQEHRRRHLGECQRLKLKLIELSLFLWSVCFDPDFRIWTGLKSRRALVLILQCERKILNRREQQPFQERESLNSFLNSLALTRANIRGFFMVSQRFFRRLVDCDKGGKTSHTNFEAERVRGHLWSLCALRYTVQFKISTWEKCHK